MIRNVYFRHSNNKLVKIKLDLPGKVLHPPMLLLFRGELYRNTGTGLGGDMPTNFYYHVKDSFMIVEESTLP